MRAKLRPVHVLPLMVVVLPMLLNGCSSGGAGGTVTTGSDAASGQVAAALLVQEWAQILWGLVTNQTGTGTPSFGPPAFNPDGSVSQTYTAADGTVVVITGYPDGSIILDTTLPDGKTQRVEAGIPLFDGVSKTSVDYQLTSSDGLAVNYTSVVDDKGTITDISDDTTALTGTSTLPDGKTQQFDVLTDGGETVVESRQSDGSTFDLTVPLAGPQFILPDFSEPATARYRSPDFDIDLTIEASAAFPTRWASLGADLGRGLTGSFALEADFSGSGRLIERGNVFALLSWSPTGKTQVRFVAAGSGAASPAGAAADFLTHRWQTLQGLLAPAPGVSGLRGQPWEPR